MAEGIKLKSWKYDELAPDKAVRLFYEDGSEVFVSREEFDGAKETILAQTKDIILSEFCGVLRMGLVMLTNTLTSKKEKYKVLVTFEYGESLYAVLEKAREYQENGAPRSIQIVRIIGMGKGEPEFVPIESKERSLEVVNYIMDTLFDADAEELEPDIVELENVDTGELDKYAVLGKFLYKGVVCAALESLTEDEDGAREVLIAKVENEDETGYDLVEIEDEKFECEAYDEYIRLSGSTSVD